MAHWEHGPEPLSSPPSGAEPWELIAPFYEHDITPVFQPFAEEALRLAALAPGARVLDVAAGPGTLALMAAARGAARVDAVDFAPRMVERLAARAAEAGLVHVHAQVADGQALPFPDASFDAAFSLVGVIFFPDRARGLTELARVVRPGGAVVVSSWPPATGVVALLFELIAGLSAELAGPPEAPPDDAPPDDAPLGDAPAYARELGAAGLTAVHVVSVGNAVAVDGVEALVARQERTLIPLVLLRRRAADGWPALRARLVERLRARLGDGRIVIDLPGLVGVGRKPG
jgi:SAM-dependent methyltransferase